MIHAILRVKDLSQGHPRRIIKTLDLTDDQHQMIPKRLESIEMIDLTDA
jgi:hypothetical protein